MQIKVLAVGSMIETSTVKAPERIGSDILGILPMRTTAAATSRAVTDIIWSFFFEFKGAVKTNEQSERRL